jgi:hypothetical protein
MASPHKPCTNRDRRETLITGVGVAAAVLLAVVLVAAAKQQIWSQEARIQARHGKGSHRRWFFPAAASTKSGLEMVVLAAALLKRGKRVRGAKGEGGEGRKN